MSSPKNHKPAYPPEFRQQMVELVKAGQRPSELAKEFGCRRFFSPTKRAVSCATTEQSYIFKRFEQLAGVFNAQSAIIFIVPEPEFPCCLYAQTMKTSLVTQRFAA